MRTLRRIKECPRKQYWNSLNLKGKERYQTLINKEIGLIVSDETRYTGNELRNRFNDCLKDFSFDMKKQKDIVVDVAVRRIERFYSILDSENIEYLEKGALLKMSNPTGVTVTAHVSFICTYNGEKYALLVDPGKSYLSYVKRAEGYVGKSEELYLLQTLTKCKPLIMFLQAKDESNDEVREDIKTNKLLYTYSFSKEESSAIDESLRTLLATDVSRTALKISKKCDNCVFKSLCIKENIENSADVLALPIRLSSESHPLTKEQAAVVAVHSGEVRVLAGAGTGKTTCIVERIKRLYSEGKNKCLLITFTEKGALEMRNRLLQRGVDISTYTFNSFAQSIITENYKELGYSKEPTIIDESEKIRIILDILDKEPVVEGLNYSNPLLKMFKAKGAVYQAIDLIRYIDRSGRNVSDGVAKYNEENKADFEDVNNLETIYSTYKQYIFDNQLMDYDDQVWSVLSLFSKDKNILDRYKNKYKHIVIDEFQDTSLEQLDLIRMLYEKSSDTSLMVVGDDAQSIFGFRGVSVENILKFSDYFPDERDLVISENFRSTQEILNLADVVYSKNKEKLKKSLVSKEHGPRPSITIEESIDEAFLMTVDKIKTLISLGAEMRDIAVITKTRNNLLSLRKVLDKENISNIISFSDFLRDDEQIIAMANLLEFVDNPSNTKALAVWLSKTNFEEFSNGNAEKMIEDSLCLVEEYKNCKDKYSWYFNKLQSNFKVTSMPMQSFIKSHSALSFEEFSSKLKRIVEYQSGESCEKDDTVYDAVTLSTVHAAKGREWKYVFVLVYNFKELKEENEFDPEEVRSIYVALTRAKGMLTVVTTPKMAGLFEQKVHM